MITSQQLNQVRHQIVLRNNHFRRWITKTILLFALIAFPIQSHADVNVLVIGSTKDSSDFSFITGDSTAFSPTGVKTQLENILSGDSSLGTVNVSFENMYKTNSYPYYWDNEVKTWFSRAYSSNLVSWFHYPFPADVEATTRWPNLRGEGGTVWDYIVLIGDPYTMENMPGLYTHGVAKIAEEVAKGANPAEIILLMPWTATESVSLDHYKEVVYRTGRSGDFKVAPAGLAWAAAGSPVGATHPSDDGAYIAAASLYSRIWGKSAKISTYIYDDNLADTVHTTVEDNKGAVQYSGKFEFQSPFKFFNNKSRSSKLRKTGGGSSTENDLVEVTNRMAQSTGAEPTASGTRYWIGRNKKNSTDGKDYRLANDRSFGYFYQSEGNNTDTTMGNIITLELDLADRMIDENDGYRLCPRRILLGGLLQFEPDMRIVGGGHIYGSQALAMSTYMATMISGRCPADPEPSTIDWEWNAKRVGYEMAWHVETLQVRAPGFKVLPGRTTIPKETPETLTVEFLNQPNSDVTVTIASNSSDVILSPASLTFTPDNHEVKQSFTVIAKSGAVVGAALNVSFSTSSDDEVFDDLSDSWSYNINQPPVANDIVTEVIAERASPVNLTSSDANDEDRSYIIVDQPEHGTLVLNGSVAVYTSNPGYSGSDSFTFRAKDGGDTSNLANVSITVIEPTLYDFNLLINPGAELLPITDFNWVIGNGEWSTSGGQSGAHAFAPASNNAELYQEIDLSAYNLGISSGVQTFILSGYGRSNNDRAYVIIEFRNAAGEILSSHRTKNLDSWWEFHTNTHTAPSGATTARITLFSILRAGSHNGAFHDTLSFTAIEPTTPYINWGNGSDFHGDDNNDGVSNGFAWALGATNPSSDAKAMMPKVDPSVTPGFMEFSYPRSDLAHNDPTTFISTEYSTNLSDWTTAVDDGESVLIEVADEFYGPGVDKVDVKVKNSFPGDTSGLFLRLKVAR